MATDNPSLRDRTCDHCGLPLGRGGFEPEPGRPFCCYGCYLVQRVLGPQEEGGIAAWILARLGVGAFLAMNVMMISLVLYTEAPASMTPQIVQALHWVLLVLSAPALLIMGVPFLRSAWQELAHRRLNMDALIAMGAFSAFGVSTYHVLRGEGPIYFDTAAMLLVLVTVGKLLEASAKSHTSKLMRGLLQLGSRMARRLTSAGEEEVTPEEVQPGDQVVVRPGEQVPVDGVIREGTSSVQEAAFTGEVRPRDCSPGDAVYGGSLNGDGRLVIEATRVGENALLGQMVRLVRQAQARRAPLERLADRLAALFVPLVWVLALGSASYWALLHHDFARAGMASLSVLVVACPCALGLATPLAVSLSIGRAAQAGILVRSGESLEALPRITHLFVDKTGTLTRGTLTLTALTILSPAESEDRVLSWTATLESASEHPVARAIVAAAQERHLELGQVHDFRAIPGSGAEGRVLLGGEERTLIAGTSRFLTDRLNLEPENGIPQDEGHSSLYVAWGGQVRARFDLNDHARPDAADMVADLTAQGVEVTLLSGDCEEIAARLADEVGIERVRAPCTPADKVAAVETARHTGAVVAMVGDGINDAPALATADVGIALASGTDLAREAGDVVLLGPELGRLPWILGLARQTYRLIVQNLSWALGYNVLTLTIAFFGRLHPLLAALLMLFSSFVVLGNSLRLLKIQPLNRETPAGPE